MSYAQFIESKRITIAPVGLTEVPPLNPMLFEFQRDITSWALRRGRAAIFAGTGLGKSFMELEWARCVSEHINRPVLIVAPLAVSHQFVTEGAHFHEPVKIAETQKDIDEPTVYTTNYEKLEHFDLDSFGGIVLDESSRIKAHDGKTRTWLIKSCARIPYRLCATATPAPNDYMELGNHAEFLGIMSYTEMLSMFFNHDGGETSKWTLRRHATNDFWKWLSGWSVCVAHPRDLGYEQDGYDLPPLNYHEHVVRANQGPSIETGMLFALEAHTMQERLAARRDTVEIRCAKAAEIAATVDGPCAIWCNLNTESSLLAKLIPGAVEVKGSDSDKHKEQAVRWFKGDICICNKLASRDKLSTWIKITSSDTIATTEKKDSSTQRNGSNPIESTEKNICKSGSSGTETRFQNIEREPQRSEIAAEQNCTRNDQANELRLLNQRDNIEKDFQKPGYVNTSGHTTSPSKSTSQPQKKGALFAEEKRVGTENACMSIIVTKQDAQEECCARPVILDLASSPIAQNDSKKQQCICGHISGKRTIISKSSIFGFGLNLQACNNTIFVGLNDSFEQIYQSIRRFWRFGQTKEVNAHFIAADTEGAVVRNIKRKEELAENMIRSMVEHMKDLNRVSLRGTSRQETEYNPTKQMELPTWIR